MDIQTTLVLSTSHLKKSTATMFSNGEAPDGMIVDNIAYGYLIYVGEERDGFEQDLPEEMEAAVRLAWQHGCEYIRYDCDGPVVDLPVYVW